MSGNREISVVFLNGDETDGIVPGNVGSVKIWGTVYLKANVRKLMKS